MTKPTPETLAALVRAGWTDRRRVDVDDLARRLEENASEPHEPWRAFMEGFADLELATRGGKEIDLDIADAIGYETDLVHTAAKRIGIELTLFGQYRDSLLLCMAPDGRVFGFHGEDWNFRTRLVGIDGMDALNRLMQDEEYRADGEEGAG